MKTKLKVDAKRKKTEEPIPFGRSPLTYGSYLKVPELLSLQKPQSFPPHHDEYCFIIIHQAYELWFKLLLLEGKRAQDLMDQGKVLGARHFVVRMVEIVRLLVRQIHILETMAPADFLAFRDRLMPASGFQSLQFRELEFFAGLKEPRFLKFFAGNAEALEALQMRLEAPSLRDSLFKLLRKSGFQIRADAARREASLDDKDRLATVKSLVPIYEDREKYLSIYLLLESLLDFDQELMTWREHHVKVVERIIGFKKGTGGSSGVDYLESTVRKKCFPSLWEIRTVLGKTNQGAYGVEKSK